MARIGRNMVDSPSGGRGASVGELYITINIRLLKAISGDFLKNSK
jgi:hypothetical protein